MTINEGGWRPERPQAERRAQAETFTGNKALMLEEPLIFEIGSPDATGVDFEPANMGPEVRSSIPWEGAVDDVYYEMRELERRAPIGLPGLSEPEMVRHYTRLSRQNYAIDLGLFPLGSCTMKHNPRLNEKVARMPGFADIHPLQPADTVQGAYALIHLLAEWLIKLTGMHSVAMSPKAGAHGELCGVLAIRSALEARGDARAVILVPESAHGTNPATAAFAGYRVENIPATARGLVYCDGANFNAIVGRVRPGDLGIDAMHINLHKTFSTPHGGGGPGSGPVVFSEALTPFAPLPFVEKQGDTYVLIEEENAGEHHGQGFGRMTAFHGQMGMFTRALTYMMSHGADGLRQVAEDAVLNANYVLRSLDDILDAPFGASGPCMHEALFSDKGFAGGLTTLDLAKALIDEGYHPMTMYFPLVVHGAMLVEPTETESKAALDEFVGALRSVAERAKAGDESLKAAPIHAPRRRLDETLAARKPILVYKAPEQAEAAE